MKTSHDLENAETARTPTLSYSKQVPRYKPQSTQGSWKSHIHLADKPRRDMNGPLELCPKIDVLAS